jgi:hypothetical protein
LEGVSLTFGPLVDSNGAEASSIVVPVYSVTPTLTNGNSSWSQNEPLASTTQYNSVRVSFNQQLKRSAPPTITPLNGETITSIQNPTADYVEFNLLTNTSPANIQITVYDITGFSPTTVQISHTLT